MLDSKDSEMDYQVVQFIAMAFFVQPYIRHVGRNGMGLLYVEFKKCPCRWVDFRGPNPYLNELKCWEFKGKQASKIEFTRFVEEVILFYI